MAVVIINTKSSGLNMRSAPNSGAPVLKVIPKGTQVALNYVLPNSDPTNWQAVSYNGAAGYVAKQYLIYPSSTITSTSIDTSTQPNKSATTSSIINNSNNNSMAMTMTEASRKKLKVGLIVGGAIAAGALIYMSRDKLQAPSTTTSKSLSGVDRKKCKKKRLSSKKRKPSKKIIRLN